MHANFCCLVLNYLNYLISSFVWVSLLFYLIRLFCIFNQCFSMVHLICWCLLILYLSIGRNVHVTACEISSGFSVDRSCWKWGCHWIWQKLCKGITHTRRKRCLDSEKRRLRGLKVIKSVASILIQIGTTQIVSYGFYKQLACCIPNMLVTIGCLLQFTPFSWPLPS